MGQGNGMNRVITKAGTVVLQAAPPAGSAIEILWGQFSVKANNTVTFDCYDPPLVEDATSGRDIGLPPTTLAEGKAFTIKTSTSAKTTIKWTSRIVSTHAPVPGPINCAVSAWSPWSDWTPINDTQEQRTRTRTITTAPSDGGAACPPLTETQTRLISTPNGLPDPTTFTANGYHDVGFDGLDSPFMAGLTSRRRNGVLSFFSILLHGTIVEYDESGTLLRSWPDATPSTQNFYTALNWDEGSQRLWYFLQQDYGSSGTIYPRMLTGLVLNDNGTIGGTHTVTLEEPTGKGAYGGSMFPPADAGLGDVLTGFGGYTSLMAQASKCSMGFALFAHNHPLTAPNGSTIPATALADHRGGTSGTDWYLGGVPTPVDRGYRETAIVNYCDGGDPRSNPATPPDIPPVAGAQWLSPAPDGHGRFVWGDSYFNTGCWIETPTIRGVLAVASVGAGKVWYESSVLRCDSRAFEWHVFDPAHLLEAKGGTRQTWQVQPVSMTPFTLTGAPLQQSAGGVNIGNVCGMTFDATSQRVYLLMTGVNVYDCRIFAFTVSA